MEEAARKRWQQEQERLKNKELSAMAGRATPISAPIIDESFDGGPAGGMSLQKPDGSMELHRGLTVLDQYALVALREYIRKGVGVVPVEGGKPDEVKLDTDALARAVIGTALSCIAMRNRNAWAPAAEQPLDEIAAAKARSEDRAPGDQTPPTVQ